LATRNRDRERLKDGDTTVSSLFASQEGNKETGNETYIDHTLSRAEIVVPNAELVAINQHQTLSSLQYVVLSSFVNSQAFASFLKNTSTSSTFLFSC